MAGNFSPSRCRGREEFESPLPAKPHRMDTTSRSPASFRRMMDVSETHERGHHHIVTIEQWLRRRVPHAMKPVSELATHANADDYAAMTTNIALLRDFPRSPSNTIALSMHRSFARTGARRGG